MVLGLRGGFPAPGRVEPLGQFRRVARVRVGEEEASLVDGHAEPGIADDADVLVETDAIGFYHLVVNRQLEGARVEGDVALLERVLAAFAPTPLLA